jgi:hypothetical protein
VMGKNGEALVSFDVSIPSAARPIYAPEGARTASFDW